MKTIIVTNNSMRFYGGSELIAVDLCNYLINKDYNVYLCSFDIGNPLIKHIDSRVKIVNLNNTKIPIKEADLIIGHHNNVIDKVLEVVKCKTIIQNSLSVLPGVEDYSKHATILLANSEETKALKKDKVTLPIKVFKNSCNETYFKQTKQLRTNINKIAIITNHDWHKWIRLPKVDIIGSYYAKYVDPSLLLQYDVVITIGRTVQQCLCLGIPVYCYDHFGGPGYITKNNLNFNEYFNFSGRQQLNNLTEIKQPNFNNIFTDIYNNYSNVCNQQKDLVEIARQRYNFNKNMDEILLSIGEIK